MTFDDLKIENEKLLRLLNDISIENERLHKQLKDSTVNINKLINIIDKIMEDN